MAQRKIVKTLRFSNDTNNEYEINAHRTQNSLTVGSKSFNGSENITIDTTDLGLPSLTETWIFDCGNSTTVM